MRSLRGLTGVCAAMVLLACGGSDDDPRAADASPATDASSALHDAMPGDTGDRGDATESLDAVARIDSEAPDGGDASTDPCRDAPFETYETFGRGFLLTWCAGCHAATSTERFGAPVDVSFDTREDVRAFRERILARAGTEPYTMPPSGGTGELDRERLRVWLTCFETGTDAPR